MRGNLNDNQAKIDNADKAVRAALERKRKIIMQSKQIAYNILSELYGKDGQELVDAVTAEHTLISKLTASGMTYEQISELADDSSVNTDNSFDESDADKYGKQMSFSETDHSYSE